MSNRQNILQVIMVPTDFRECFGGLGDGCKVIDASLRGESMCEGKEFVFFGDGGKDGAKSQLDL